MKLKVLITIFAFLLLSACHAISIANDFKVELTTQDGRAKIRVYGSLPTAINKNAKVPVVIVVPGTFDSADPFFDPMNPDFSLDPDGLSGLGKKLNQMGIAVLRYDTRGMIAGRECMQGRATALKFREYLKSCRIDSDLIQVNFKTLRSDLAQVITYAKNLPQIDQEKLGIIAMSEGFLHAANLIGAKRVSGIKLLVGMGAAIEAPRTIYVKQRYATLIDLLKSQFSGVADQVLSSEILADIAEHRLSKGDWISLLFPAKKNINLADVLAVEKMYQKQLAEEFEETARAAPGSVHMRQVNGINIIERSMAYWQDFTTNASAEVMPLDELSNFDGMIKIFYGVNDNKVDVVASTKIIDQIKKKNNKLIYSLYQDLGHRLDKKDQRIPTSVTSEIAKEFSVLLE